MTEPTIAELLRAYGEHHGSVLCGHLADCYEALAELEDAASAHEAVQHGASDPRVGVTQPITVAEGNALIAALSRARDALAAAEELRPRLGGEG